MKQLAILILIITFFSCSDDNEKVDYLSNNKSLQDELIVKQPEAKRINEDTIVSDKVSLIFESSNKSTFNSAETTVFVNKDSSAIRRDGQKWIFKLLNGDEKNIISNDTSDEGDSYVVYSFIGKLEVANYWLFDAAYYESDDYLLIDMDNGEIIHLMGYPFISPDKKILISGASNLDYDNSSGIQLFEIEDGKILEVISKDLITRGLLQYRWLNDTTVIAQEEFLNNNDLGKKYSKIHLKFNSDN
jgi:hypothetical protein